VDVRAALERVWRSDSAGMLGVLAARLGDLDRAEEALQEVQLVPAGVAACWSPSASSTPQINIA
jgi:predicted RNA polymerase sigma factor